MKLFKTLLLFLPLLFAPLMAETNEDIPEPYRSIQDIPFDGWGFFYNGNQLIPHLNSRNIKTAIEVGSWTGCSTRFIASNLAEGGKLYAVDTCLGTLNEPVHQQDPRLPFLYQLFLSNVKHANLYHKIIPIRMESLEAAVALNVMADFIYLDAAHDADSVYKDIHAWMKHLNEGGLMCGDDWTWETVREAVYKAAVDFNKEVKYDANFWWYE